MPADQLNRQQRAEQQARQQHRLACEGRQQNQ
jgi:hypothetical protein